MSSSLPGSLLPTGVAEALQPHGSQQLLTAGLFLLLFLLLLRLAHQDGVQLPGLCPRALPPPALQPPGLLLPGPLLAKPAGELLCPRIHTLLQPHRLSIHLSCGRGLFQEGFADELWNVLQYTMIRPSAVLFCLLTVNMILFEYSVRLFSLMVPFAFQCALTGLCFGGVNMTNVEWMESLIFFDQLLFFLQLRFIFIHRTFCCTKIKMCWTHQRAYVRLLGTHTWKRQ